MIAVYEKEITLQEKGLTLTQSNHISTNDPKVMGHDKMSLYSEILQDNLDATTNGIDDEAEIEAAAAQSEQAIPPVVSQLSSSLKPLHVQVNGFSGSGQTSISRSYGSESSFSYASPIQKKRHNPLPSPAVRPNHRPNLIMGPPSGSSQVLLSPAGSLHNGYSNRQSVEASPNSPVFNQKSQKRDFSTHPLAINSTPSTSHKFSNQLSQRGFPHSSSFHISNTSPTVRKDAEMSKRRIFSDKIHKLREENVLSGFLHHTEHLTDTQVALFMRRCKTEMKILPTQVYNEAYNETQSTELSQNEIGGRLRSMHVLKVRDNDPDEMTDLSDDDDETSVGSKIWKGQTSPIKVMMQDLLWNESKMNLQMMFSKTEALLDEKCSARSLMEQQMDLFSKSSGCRFANQPAIPKKRRKVDGHFKFESPADGREPEENIEEFGCSRARPLISWTRRKIYRNIFSKSTNETVFDPTKPGCSTTSEKLPSVEDRHIPIAENKVVTVIAETGERIESTEYDYQTYEEGKGMLGLKYLSEEKPLDYIISDNFKPIESRIMSYLFRLSTVSSMALRKRIDLSIMEDTGIEEKTRNGTERVMIRERRDFKEKRRDRKYLNDSDGSDDDDWINKTEQRKNSKIKRSRGRPAKYNKKPNFTTRNMRSSSNSVKHQITDIDDYIVEDSSNFQPPEKIPYARINIPKWETISDSFWDLCSNDIAEGDADNLQKTQCLNHHKLSFLEQEWFKRKLEKKNRQANKGKKAIAPMTPSPSPCVNDDIHWNSKELLKSLPPYDDTIYDQNRQSLAVRKYASTVKPYEKRVFPLSEDL